MHLLVLSPVVPSPTGSGGQRRVHHLLLRLVELGHRVTVCCPIPADQRAAVEAARADGLDVVGRVRPASRTREVLQALARRPLRAWGLLAHPLQRWQLDVLWGSMDDAVRAALRRRPDAALVVWDLAAAWRRHLPPELPCTVDLHDASWEYVAGRARLATGWRAPAFAADAARLRRHVRRWLPRYDQVVCVSDADAERTRALTHTTPAVVTNGVDLEAFRPLPPATGTPEVLFSGTMNYAPNAAGATWLVQRVWPAVRAALPDAHLSIVGRHPPAEVTGLAAAPGVRVVGEVPDMTPYFAAAQVVVVPLSSGGGTRLKVLEAAAVQRPMVTTTVGIEGLAFRDGPDVCVADEPAAFAAAVVALLRSERRRSDLAASARAVVEARYGWAALGDRLDGLLEATR